MKSPSIHCARRLFPAREVLVLMVLVSTATHGVIAEDRSNYEVVVPLYNVDYTEELDRLDHPVMVEPMVEGPLPDKQHPTAQRFGAPMVSLDPHGYAETTALMLPRATPNGVFFYSQLDFDLVHSSYFFRSFSIRLVFKMHPSVGYLSLDVMGGGFGGIHADSDGNIRFGYYPDEPDPSGRTRTEVIADAAGFDIDRVVVLECDLNDVEGRVTVRVNGVETVVENVGSEPFFGIYNGAGLRSPIRMRLNYDSRDPGVGKVALYEFAVSGRDWEGPTYWDPSTVAPAASEALILPVSLPPSEYWQGQFSFNLKEWYPFGVPALGRDIKGLLSHVGLAGRSYFRFVEVDVP